MISMVTLNLRAQMAIDRQNAFFNRRHALIPCLCGYGADLMAFQEMTDRMRACMAARLDGWAFVGERTTERGGRGDANVIAYRESTLALEETGTFWLSYTPNLPGSRFLLQAPSSRTCTWATFRHRQSGVRFRYFNTHLDHLSAPARAKGMAVVLRRMDQAQRKEKLPMFLGGDFNFTPSSAVYAMLGTIPVGGAPLVDLSGDIGGSFHWFGRLKRPWKLDYLLADAETAAGCVPAESYRYDDAGGFLSDHDALYLRWGGDARAAQQASAPVGAALAAI